MSGGPFGSSRSAREGRRLFGIGGLVGLVLNLCLAPLFNAPTAHAQEPGFEIITVQRTVDGIKGGALAPVNEDSPAHLQQQAAIYEAVFGVEMNGAGSYYDLDVFPAQGDIAAAVNLENDIPVTLEAVAVFPIDFAEVDFGALGLSEEELALYAASKPVSNMVIGRLISDWGEAEFVGMGVSWEAVDGVVYAPMLKVMGDISGFFAAGLAPEDFVVGLGRPFVEQAQAAAGVTCPDGRVVPPDAQYNTCMGNAQITLEHCLIDVAILLAKCIASAVATQVIRMLGCKRLVLPWLVKACLIALAAWLAAQIIWCTVNVGGGALSCANNYVRDTRICANELCGRTPVVNPGPVTPVQPGAKVEQQLEEHHIQGALNIANQ